MRRVQKNWTDEDVQFIEANFRIMKQKEIAEHLGRTPASVNSKIKQLRLIKNPKIGKVRNLLKKGDMLCYSEIMWLQEQGVTLIRIAQAVGINVNRFKEFMKNHETRLLEVQSNEKGLRRRKDKINA